MTIFIFHGDNQLATRRDLRSFVSSQKKASRQLNYLNGLKLLPAELEIALGTNNLFTPEALVIENLFSRPRSKARLTCLKLIQKYQGPKDLALWDKKSLTKTQLKGFPRGTVSKLRQTPPVIFRFLDSLRPGSSSRSLPLLHQTAAQVDEGFIFIMLARRVAALLIAQSGHPEKLSPWQRSRLITQAQAWPEKRLLQFHRQLLKLDTAVKTGKTKLSYLEFLDILLTNLLGWES